MRHIDIAGKEYRVEANFNAIMDFMENEGESNLDIFSSTLSIKQWVSLMICCINEGERLEGRSYEMTAKDFGTLSFVEVSKAVQSFIKIFSAQNGVDESAEKAKKK